jgi:serine/threonine protein phosphatase 1
MTDLPPIPTDGRLLYAIGDVHGRDDLLAILIERIRQDAGPRRAELDALPMLVMLGDYIDRGRKSSEVLDRLIVLRDAGEFDCRFLLGNHEDAMLHFIDGRSSGRGWARFGGRATMESYGVRAPLSEDDSDGWAAAREALQAAMPTAHLALLRAMEPVLEFNDGLMFVHAGIRPGVALADQSRDDLLGIRSDFLDHDEDLACFVVHGHTPVEACDLRPRRLNLDTGAYMTGMLSAARFDGSAPVILAVGAGQSRAAS